MIQRHEYTWSDHSLTGRGNLGWGITASSSPDHLPHLREMEKIAAQVPADHEGGSTTEGLSYSAECGFVRFTCVSGGFGKDLRHNKIVHLYEMGKEPDPSFYMAALPDWDQDRDGILDPLPGLAKETDLGEMIEGSGLKEELSSFLDAIYRCLLSGDAPLVLREENADLRQKPEEVRKLMELIHRLIPPVLRPKAAYLSCREREGGQAPFLISDGFDSGFVYTLHEEKKERPDLFFSQLAEEILSDSSLYRTFYYRMDRFLSGCSDETNLLEKVRWIFYGMCRDKGKEALDFGTLSQAYPDLVYWSKENEMLEDPCRRVREDLECSMSDPEEDAACLSHLVRGITVRTKGEILTELDRVSRKLYQADPAVWEQEMNQIAKENSSLLASIVTEGSDDYDQALERIVSAGRKKEEKAAKARRKPKSTMKKEADKKASPPERKEETIKDKAAEQKDQEEEIRDIKVVRSIRPGTDLPAEARVRAVEEESMGSLLLSSIPQGFMTGSFLFLAWYSIKIGHWKIALGLLGMWLLIMLGYDYMLLVKKEPYPLWQILGLCCIEGLVIQAVAWFLPTKSLRLIYFLILGILTLAFQTITVIKTRRNISKENDDE